MKEAIAILTGGGPAPGHEYGGGQRRQNVPCQRVSRDRSALRLFGSFQSLAPLRRPDFHAGRLHLQSGRFVPHDEPFQTDRQGFRGEFQPQFLHREQRQAARDRRRRRHRVDGQPHRQVPRSEALPHRQHPRPEDDRQRPAAAGRHADVRLPVGQGGRNGHRPRRLQRRTHVGQLVRRSGPWAVRRGTSPSASARPATTR